MGFNTVEDQAGIRMRSNSGIWEVLTTCSTWAFLWLTGGYKENCEGGDWRQSAWIKTTRSPLLPFVSAQLRPVYRSSSPTRSHPSIHFTTHSNCLPIPSVLSLNFISHSTLFQTPLPLPFHSLSYSPSRIPSYVKTVRHRSKLIDSWTIGEIGALFISELLRSDWSSEVTVSLEKGRCRWGQDLLDELPGRQCDIVSDCRQMDWFYVLLWHWIRIPEKAVAFY
jgi:hypothetical protein